jgi:hypothetical protein
MNINQNQWARSFLLGVIFSSATLLTSPVLAQQEQQQQESSADAVRGLSHQAEGKVNARHVVGLENIKRNRSGSLIILDGELRFQAGKMNANLPLASIDDISVGTEITRAGGRAGTVAKTAAVAAPYHSGAALSICCELLWTHFTCQTGIRAAVCITRSWHCRKGKGSNNALI